MKQTKVALPDDLREAVKMEAARSDRSESSVIRQALRAYLEGKENGNADESV